MARPLIPEDKALSKMLFSLVDDIEPGLARTTMDMRVPGIAWGSNNPFKPPKTLNNLYKTINAIHKTGRRSNRSRALIRNLVEQMITAPEAERMTISRLANSSVDVMADIRQDMLLEGDEIEYMSDLAKNRPIKYKRLQRGIRASNRVARLRLGTTMGRLPPSLSLRDKLKAEQGHRREWLRQTRVMEQDLTRRKKMLFAISRKIKRGGLAIMPLLAIASLVGMMGDQDAD